MPWVPSHVPIPSQSRMTLLLFCTFSCTFLYSFPLVLSEQLPYYYLSCIFPAELVPRSLFMFDFPFGDGMLVVAQADFELLDSREPPFSPRALELYYRCVPVRLTYCIILTKSLIMHFKFYVLPDERQHYWISMNPSSPIWKKYS